MNILPGKYYIYGRFYNSIWLLTYKGCILQKPYPNTCYFHHFNSKVLLLYTMYEQM